MGSKIRMFNTSKKCLVCVLYGMKEGCCNNNKILNINQHLVLPIPLQLSTLYVDNSKNREIIAVICSTSSRALLNVYLNNRGRLIGGSCSSKHCTTYLH